MLMSLSVILTTSTQKQCIIPKALNLTEHITSALGDDLCADIKQRWSGMSASLWGQRGTQTLVHLQSKLLEL